MEKVWTIVEIIRLTTDFFTKHQVASPRLDAELLLAYVLGLERIQLYVQFDRPLDKEELAEYRELVRRRAAHEPVAYILGQKEFWSLTFKVSPKVLIPRPDTEVLVETALKTLKAYRNTQPLILDLATGSGNIIISLAKELPQARLSASDLSEAALETARENARAHGVADRITWYCGDLFNCLLKIKGQVDLLVSNPPYIAERQLAALQPEVRDFEPRQALAAGSDGLDIYRKIAAQAGKWLKKGAWLCLEIGAEQAAAVKRLLSDSGQFDKIQITKDYAGLNRVVSAQRFA